MRSRSLRHARYVLIATLVATIGAFAMPGAAAAATQGCAVDTAGVTDLTTSWEVELLSLTNAHRTSRGLPVLQLDATLTKASAWKARDMARRSYMEHDDPASGAAPSRSPWDRLTECGWTSGGSRAENIAAGYSSPQSVITGWINSPGHRANIENSAMRYVGFGVASSTSSRYGTYSAQMFASVPGPNAATPVAPAAPASPTVTSLSVIVGDAPRVLCPVVGAAFIVDDVAGLVDATVAGDGCMSVSPRAGATASSATVTYRARATAGGATSTPVNLLVTITDRDRDLLDEGAPTTDGGGGRGGSLQASRVSVTSARLARSRCTDAWAVRGWCWRIVIRGRVLLADHAPSADRSIVVSRMTASRRPTLAGRTTTDASGAFTLSARVRPSPRAAATWLARNASRIRVGTSATTTAAADVAWVTAGTR